MNYYNDEQTKFGLYIHFFFFVYFGQLIWQISLRIAELQTFFHELRGSFTVTKQKTPLLFQTHQINRFFYYYNRLINKTTIQTCVYHSNSNISKKLTSCISVTHNISIFSSIIHKSNAYVMHYF